MVEDTMNTDTLAGLTPLPHDVPVTVGLAAHLPNVDMMTILPDHLTGWMWTRDPEVLPRRGTCLDIALEAGNLNLLDVDNHLLLDLLNPPVTPQMTNVLLA